MASLEHAMTLGRNKVFFGLCYVFGKETRFFCRMICFWEAKLLLLLFDTSLRRKKFFVPDCVSQSQKKFALLCTLLLASLSPLTLLR